MTEQKGWRGRQQGWDPMGELQSLRSELSRLVGGRSGGQDVDLAETADGWEVVVRLPGVAPEEVAVELDDRELCVRARSEAEVNADHGIPGGFTTRGFEYRVDLPSRVDPDRIDAVMDHGLLRVRLPRERPGVRPPQGRLEWAPLWGLAIGRSPTADALPGRDRRVPPQSDASAPPASRGT